MFRPIPHTHIRWHGPYLGRRVRRRRSLPPLGLAFLNFDSVVTGVLCWLGTGLLELTYLPTYSMVGSTPGAPTHRTPGQR